MITKVQPSLSKRGTAHAASVTPFWAIFDDLLQNAFDSHTGHGKYVNMGIANNSLMSADLLKYFNSNLKLLPEDLTYGTSLFGSTRLFAALCKLYNSAHWSPHTPVEPSQIITGPGCGSILDQLAEHLAEPGEAFLVAAPYYNGFDADLKIRAGVKCLGVFSDRGDGSEKESFEGKSAMRGFEERLVEAEKEGVKVRAVFLCQPCNPVGRCYDRDAMIEYGRFCEKHDLFLISDEIYALSVFPTKANPNPTPFTSALAIDWAKEAGINPARITVVSSASKDFTSNGLRLGTLVCQHNRQLISAMKSTAKLAMVSSAADALWSGMINDDEFLNWFIETNRQRLSAAYEKCREWCEKMEIKYTPSNAGHFFMVDLESFLPNTLDGTILDTAESETALWARFLDFGVAVTPGHNYHCRKRGVFRMTFALEETALKEGLERLEQALKVGKDPVAPPKDAIGATAFICGPVALEDGLKTVKRRSVEEHDEALRERLAMLQVAASCSACCC